MGASGPNTNLPRPHQMNRGEIRGRADTAPETQVIEQF